MRIDSRLLEWFYGMILTMLDSFQAKCHSRPGVWPSHFVFLSNESPGFREDWGILSRRAALPLPGAQESLLQPAAAHLSWPGLEDQAGSSGSCLPTRRLVWGRKKHCCRAVRIIRLQTCVHGAQSEPECDKRLCGNHRGAIAERVICVPQA